MHKCKLIRLKIAIFYNHMLINEKDLFYKYWPMYKILGKFNW